MGERFESLPPSLISLEKLSIKVLYKACPEERICNRLQMVLFNRYYIPITRPRVKTAKSTVPMRARFDFGFTRERRLEHGKKIKNNILIICANPNDGVFGD